ncbi:MAG: HAD family phosphatase [Opitutaceae bacterium]|jgi:HAD superfamily hydrolase (TIGR01509 family)
MQLNFPSGDFAGYIFDCDGTLIDSMPVHYLAWDAALRKNGLKEPLNKDLFYSLGGVPTKKVAELLGKHYKLSIDPDKVFHLKEELFVDMLPNVKLIAPVVDYARRVALKHPVSVASGGPRLVVQRSLELAGLADLFKIVVTADDVVHGKPSPDMFLLAAKLMGVKPEECLVFEDAEPGIQGALAAGMQVVHVPSRRTEAA